MSSICGVMDRIFGDESFEFLTWETSTGAGVKVAISDTGIDESHPDLVSRVSEGVYFTGTDSSFDDNGHGAHVSGTVAPSASLYSAKVLSSTGAVCVGASVSIEIYFNDGSSPYFTGTSTADTSQSPSSPLSMRRRELIRYGRECHSSRLRLRRCISGQLL